MNSSQRSHFQNIIQYFIISFLFLALPQISYSKIINVYVYNNEFSINLPGNPVEAAIITQGDTIRWMREQGTHTTTSVAGSPEQWNQPMDASNTEYLRQFNNVGVFVYYCIPHGSDNGDGTASGMSSSITVLAAGSGACCLPDGSCITTDEGECLVQGGYFYGTGSLCDTTYCEYTTEIIASKDNILYENTLGNTSNGEGAYLYTGNYNDSITRRAVLAFDLMEIPVHAEIQNAQLQLFCNNASSGTYPITAQKLLQNWGEGTSDDNGQESSGAPATPDDATWLHTYYDTTAWTMPGGDFSPTISATTSVASNNTTYSWDASQLITDVQSWVENPQQNFGWILRGDESSSDNIKRFTSAQGNTSAEHPRLILNYIVPPKGACCLSDGSCQDLTETQCANLGGEYNGDGTDCEEESCHIELTPFLDPLPLPGVAIPEAGTAGGSAHYRMVMEEHFQQLHSELPSSRVWGYNGSYPGPTMEARRDSLVTVRWVNDIRVFETGILRDTHVLVVDTCLHGPNMTGVVPVTVTHLHGGKVPPGSDGYPEATFPPGDSADLYYYPNIQPAATIWYHDHALGNTRLNVMMGLAGLYIIRDENEDTLGLPSGEFEVPLVIQDKSFNPDGSIHYPSKFEDHFFGEVLLVNGKVWPYHNVKKGKYRFRLVNGSNSRAYTLRFSNGAPFIQIAAELGLLETPVTLDSLTLLPGERSEIIVDFSSYAAGTEILLINSAPAPFPGFAGAGVIPNVMKFIVQDAAGFTGPIPGTLAIVEELQASDAHEERLFDLLTIPGPPCEGETHPIWTINGLKWDDITEFPVLGSTEIWTWHNQSGISHPMHMHLIAFQILDRQAIDGPTGLPTGPLIPPEPYERGWKDTAHSPPGFRTRVITRFGGFTGLYPYHCHILEHEDHEMMRQFEVMPCNVVTNMADEGPGSLRFALGCAEEGDTILFSAEISGDTILLSDTLDISKDVTLWNTNGGPVAISGQGISHLFTVSSGTEAKMKNLVLIAGMNTTGRAGVNFGTLWLEDVTIYDSKSSPSEGTVFLNQGLLQVLGNVRFLQMIN